MGFQWKKLPYLSLCYIMIREFIAGQILDSLGDGGFYGLWARDPQYPAAHYAMDHGSSIPQIWCNYWRLLNVGWSQISIFWQVPSAGGDDLHCLQSFARCHGAGWGYPSARQLGYVGGPFWSTEGAALEFIVGTGGTASIMSDGAQGNVAAFHP